MDLTILWLLVAFGIGFLLGRRHRPETPTSSGPALVVVTIGPVTDQR